MTHRKLFKRVLSLVMCLAMLMTYLPAAAAGVSQLDTAALVDTVTDPGTAHTWETMMGTDIDGNRYAGRVWVDKSVYKDGDRVILNTKGEAGSEFTVELREDENFQVVFSVLGSTMTTKSTVSSSGPLDVVLVLDDSTSMDDVIEGNTTRLEKLIEASNKLLANLTATGDIRIGIVAYNQNSMQILPFGTYQNGIELRVRNNKYTFDERNNQDKGGTIQAFDKDGVLLYNNTAGYNRGTNTQAGIHAGMTMLETARDTQGRSPVAIVLTDGAANTAAQNTFYNLGNQTPRSIFGNTVPVSVALATLLTAAYKKARVEAVYGKKPMIYGIGVDIAGDAAANAVINPGAARDGFNAENSSRDITDAYALYTQWLTGRTVQKTEYYNGSYPFTFDHGYTGVTRQEIQSNIHYVDTYYPVSSAQLNDTFEQIYQELASGVFNPISSSTSVDGGTGVDDTPLIYVDFIGQHMEVKEIQAVSLFGASYGVRDNGDGTYTVNTATGTNPTTNEGWNTSEDITIAITRTEGVQKLEIRINQEILPIILERVISETVGDVTAATITEVIQDPLRVFYTVGLDSQVLLPNGRVDVSRLQGYPYIEDATGTVHFYSNRFGVMNPSGRNGDTHVGFQPSWENRYYYHQEKQGIFTEIRDASGDRVTIPTNQEYGILWDEAQYELEWMTYEEYVAAADTDRVYTYVTYYRPTPQTTDSPNAAERVTYLVYTDWAYLKESVAFYDDNTKTYLNEGKAIPEAEVADAIARYKQQNPRCKLYAVLGVSSLRTSRLHNMLVEKTENPTGSASNRYAPEYTHDTAQLHNGNSVVVWLGNNGKLSVDIDTGIALTKAVTKPMEDPNEVYTLTVALPMGVTAAPVVEDEKGNGVSASYEDRVLKVPVKAEQTVYISGIPGGTKCQIGEIIDGDYYKVDALSTAEVTVPTLSQVLAGAAQFAPATVTNAPYEYGDLHITKRITSDHSVPDSILEETFGITVDLGRDLAGEEFAIRDSAHPEGYRRAVDENGFMTFELAARQTIDILRLPVGTAVTVTEADPGPNFAVSYRTRNHSGETPDTDNTLVIPGEGSATAIVFNHYTPTQTSVELDIAGTKDFVVEGSHGGGIFQYTVQKWDGSAWVDIPGKTAQTPYAADEAGVKTFAIENVLEGVTYTQVGNHAYRVCEVQGTTENVTFDRTLYTFDVTVTDNGGQLVATVTDRDNRPITDGVYQVRFENTWHTAPVSIDISKLVNNHSGDDTVSKAGFAFQAIRTDEFWQPLTDGNAATLTVHSDAAGKARLTATYHQAGAYYYELREVNDGRPGWSYSGATYRITVNVTEENGNLTATLSLEKTNSELPEETGVVDGADATKGSVSFLNHYAPQAVAVDLDGAVKKSLSGMTLKAEQFTFQVYRDGDRTAPVLTGTNGLNGDVSLVDFRDDLRFEGVGTYSYDIVERIPEGAVYEAATGKYVQNGMRYDPTIYDLTVEVTNDITTGKLVASYYFEDAVGSTVVYRNFYRAVPTEYVLGGVKVLNGRAPRNGEFSFSLYHNDTLLETVTNAGNGSFRFAPISYSETGVYHYTVREELGSVPGVSYTGAEAPVAVTVTVTDENGQLKATASLENPQIRFENTYNAAPATVHFAGTKTLVGADLTDGAFRFHLYQTDSSFDITKSNAQLLATDENVNGAFGFGKTFQSTGTQFFVIVEDRENPTEGIVYDRSVHRFVVRITDVGDGQLKANVISVNTGAVTATAAEVTVALGFTNATTSQATEKQVYLAGATTTQIDGQQVRAGDILTYFITYTNYTGAEVVADIMDVIPLHTSYVEGSASHGGTYAGEHLNWIVHVPKDGTVTVCFDVKVQQTNAIVANTAVVRDGVNVYFTNQVVNHTVEDVVRKDVFAPAEPTVSIDGNTVNKGDTLLYQIRYTNTTGKPADIEIVDRIPEHTAYVENSASHGGTLRSGELRWKLEDVPAWSTVTVSFRVLVGQDAAVAVKNRATVLEGENSHATNEVINPIQEPPQEPTIPTEKPTEPPQEPTIPTEKPTEPPQEPTVPTEKAAPMTPQTGDSMMLGAWLGLLLISTGGILGAVILGRKKEQAEEI